MRDVTEERWYSAIALICSSSCATGFFFLITRGVSAGWIFGILFAITTLGAAWVTTRSDDWYARRLEKQKDGQRRHPWANRLVIVAALIYLAAELTEWILKGS